MERTLRIAGIGMNNNFLEDSPQSVKPQASSTFMFSRTELDLRDIDDENAFLSPKLLSATSALSTTSSLGVIDLEKQSLLSEKDESISKRLHESVRESQSFLDEQRSLSFDRFRRRLDDISISKSASSEDSPNECKSQAANVFMKSATNDVSKILSPQNGSTKVKPVPSSPSSKVSIFSDVSNVSSPMFDSSFNCGQSAVMKLEADQKENRKQFGSLPVSPMNISMNSEDNDEREKKFAEFVRDKCYSPEEISNVLRNDLNLNMKESASVSVNTVNDLLSLRNTQENSKIHTPLNFQLPSHISNHSLQKSDSGIPAETEQFYKLEEKLSLITSNVPVRESFVRDFKNTSVNATVCNDTLEESRASSIASINQIAEALRRKSLMAEPKLAIEHLLSIGRSKSKFVPPLSPYASSTSSIPSSGCTVISQSSQNERTPATGCVNTPSTIVCSTNDLSVDSVTGKVHTRNVPYDSSFTTARKLLESQKDDKISNASEYSLPSMKKVGEKKHFSLVKTVSLLDLSDDGDSPNDEFWKLNASIEANEPGDALSNPFRAFDDKMCHLPENLLTVLKCGSAKTNAMIEPVRQISFSHNITSTLDVCDTFDGDYSSDVIHAGTLCLGTQVEVIIDIENPCRESLKYKMALKSILLNGEVNLSAVSVMLVSNCPNMILLPNSENEIKIMLSPLKQGKIDVVLEFISEEKKYSNITRQIRIVGENPKLKLHHPETAEIGFELLAESSVKNVPLLLKNGGVARLPLRLLVFEGSKRTFFARTVIEPSEIFECDVRVTTFDMSEDQPSVINLTGELMILLDTSEEASLGKLMILKSVPLSAKVGRTSVVVNDNAPLELSCSPLLKSSSYLINVTNTGMVPLDITVQTVESGQSEFLIEPHIFHLLPRNTKSLKTVFKPLTKERKREIDLHLIFNGTGKKYSTKIVGIVENDVVSSSMVTPLRQPPNTCITPHSTSSDSSTGADGPMELDSTHHSVSWGSVPLHTKNIQTITLRNRSSQKEKLLLSISDSNGAFRFVENKSSLRDLKLTLEPRESRKISIVFMPFVADQAMNGRIVIIRRHSLEASVGELQKRVIPLYGIGGSTKISFTGVFRDNENRLWITPEADSLETKFSVENTGDSVAFVKIVSEDSDDVVVPEEILLLPAESAEVNYTVYLNKDRVDSLYKQNPSKEILLANKISVFSGCESTRLRLRKLWMKYKEFENIQRIRNKIELLMDMNSPSRVMVESLSDSQFVLSNLWYEGVAEHVIGVLIPQQHLESACLDSTVVFKDLVDVTTVP